MTFLNRLCDWIWPDYRISALNGAARLLAVSAVPAAIAISILLVIAEVLT